MAEPWLGSLSRLWWTSTWCSCRCSFQTYLSQVTRSTDVAGPANLWGGWPEAKDWLQPRGRAEAERDQGQHWLAGSQVLLPNQVQQNFKCLKIEYSSLRPNVSILRSLGLNIKPGEKVFPQNFPLLHLWFRHHSLSAWHTCGWVFFNIPTYFNSITFLNRNMIFYHHDMTLTCLGCTCWPVRMWKVNSDPINPGFSFYSTCNPWLSQKTHKSQNSEIYQLCPSMFF